MQSGSVQEQWLRSDLAANTKQCTLAIWHQPKYYSWATDGTVDFPSRKVFWDDLYAANADLVLNGHKHQYERFAPQTPTGASDPARGIREIIVGTGGESSVTPTNLVAPNSEVRAATFGVLKLTLSPGAYSWKRSEEHTSELQSRLHLVCRLLLEKKKKTQPNMQAPSAR